MNERPASEVLIAQNVEQQCLAYRRCLIDEGQESKWELRYTEGTHSWGVPRDSGCLAFQYHLMIKCWTLEEWRLREEPRGSSRPRKTPFPTIPTKAARHGASSQTGHGGRRCVAVPHPGFQSEIRRQGHGTTPRKADLTHNYHGGSLSGCGVSGTPQQGHTPWSGRNRSSYCSRLGCGAAG